MLQETEQYIRIPVEENYFKPELLTHLLPVPALIVQVREGGVEEEGGNGLVRCGWREFKIYWGNTADIRFLLILFK